MYKIQKISDFFGTALDFFSPVLQKVMSRAGVLKKAHGADLPGTLAG